MPIEQLTRQQAAILDLAMHIEDPAGIEAIDLAKVILEVFGDRTPRQAELMRESLWRWSMQWPRTPTARSPTTA